MNREIRLRVWVLAGILFVLHFLLHVGFGLSRGAPDLLTVSLLLAVREIGMGRAAMLGLVFGLLEDALSVLSFGANAIALTVTAIGGAYTRDLFVGDSRFFLLSYLFIGKWGRDFVQWLAVGEELRAPFFDHVLVGGGLAALYVAVVGLILNGIFGLGREP